MGSKSDIFRIVFAPILEEQHGTNVGATAREHALFEPKMPVYCLAFVISEPRKGRILHPYPSEYGH